MFKEKLGEASISVLPVMILVVLLHFTIAPLQAGQLAQFVVGGILLIIGLAIFLAGAAVGMVPFGQKTGSALTHKRNLPILLIASFVIGFAITIAEPDVQVLATQVTQVDPSVNRLTLLVMISIGVGCFTLIGVGRIILGIPLRWLLLFFYAILFAFAILLVEPGFVAVAFDSGGATTGPVTVPFIMALGLGVAAATTKKKGDDSSFGLVGLASIGPIAAVAVMGAFGGGPLSGENYTPSTPLQNSLIDHFTAIVPHVSYEVAMALGPILILFIFFQITLLHLRKSIAKRILLGFLYTFIGLIIFMVGVNGGFIPAGQSLGIALGSLGGKWLLVVVGMVLGAVVVCAEPAVWVLTEQVEEVSGGYVKRSIMLMALSFSIAAAVAIGMVRVTTGISIWWFLIPGYSLALLLTRYCPKLFTAIAFDSGGVASGPMSTTFVLSLTLGVSLAIGSNPTTDAFGMVAMIAMAPLITIQLIGLLFQYKEKKRHESALRKEKKS